LRLDAHGGEMKSLYVNEDGKRMGFTYGFKIKGYGETLLGNGVFASTSVDTREAISFMGPIEKVRELITFTGGYETILPELQFIVDGSTINVMLNNADVLKTAHKVEILKSQADGCAQFHLGHWFIQITTNLGKKHMVTVKITGKNRATGDVVNIGEVKLGQDKLATWLQNRITKFYAEKWATPCTDVEVVFSDEESHSRLPEVQPIPDEMNGTAIHPDDVDDDETVEYVHSGIAAASTHSEIMECIARFKKKTPAELKKLAMSVQNTIEQAKDKMKKAIPISEQERRDLATDVLLMVCLEHVLDGKPIPLVGRGLKE